MIGGLRADALSKRGKTSIAKGSKSFAVAARLLDAETRDSARLLYSWCRYCDDQIDGQDFGFGHADFSGSGADRLAALRAATIDAHAGRTLDNDAFAALQRVALRHHLPLSLPLALLDGFAMDVAGRRYGAIEDTIDYCYHVAGVVGLMMARIMGVRDEATLDRACDLGIAFQLTNIARDIGDDWRNGRVYLPESWLAEAGLTRDAIGDPARAADLDRVVARLLETAEAYYASSLAGVAALPFRAAWAVGAARYIYRAIGRRVESAAARAVVPRREKLALVLLAGRDALAFRVAAPRYAPRPSMLWSRPR